MHVAQSGYRAMAPEPGRQIPIEGDARSARLIADSEAPRAWAPLRPGIEIRVLQESADGSERIALLRYRPGATVPRHRHLGDEHVYVLEGAQQDEECASMDDLLHRGRRAHAHGGLARLPPRGVA